MPIKARPNRPATVGLEYSFTTVCNILLYRGLNSSLPFNINNLILLNNVKLYILI